MNTKASDGGPAYPQHGWSTNPETIERMKTQQGMSLRAYFAGAVIGPLIGSDGFEQQMQKLEVKIDDLPKFASELAVETADALISELASGQPSHPCSCDAFEYASSGKEDAGRAIRPYADKWMIGSGSAFIKFCPWCGKPVRETPQPKL